MPIACARTKGSRKDNQAAANGRVEKVVEISLMRPQLPSARELLPYLSRIDSTRQYSNSGPLLAEFEARLASEFGVQPEHVACVANATMGLTLCLLAIGPRQSDRCIVPSWTFEATAVAARAAGLVPWFHDVSEATWALSAEDLLASLGGDTAAAVVAVCPFGVRADPAKWDSFSTKTGIPVVIDAAAGFDSLAPGRTPSVLSLHATKLLSTGEGGAVISTDADFVQRIRRLANFGFEPSRRIVISGINAKMSEYAAAVGLAGLDGWPLKRRSLAGRAHLYRKFIDAQEGVTLAPGFGDVSLQPTCNVRLSAPQAEALIDWLEADGIRARKWWGDGCHRQQAFADCPRTALPVTEALAESVVGLPFFPDIERQQIGRVVAALGKFLARAG
jgi:dTDP-4-amino-4,6-dideoxygalactose transaminase